MTVFDAIEAFREKVRAGAVHNARTEAFGPVSSAVEAQILHTVRRAARRAGGTGDLAKVAYAPLAHMLAEHAKLDAIEAGEGNGTNEAARARRFVRTVGGYPATYRRSVNYTFLPGWRPLAEAVDRMAARNGIRSRRSYLHALMELASARGKIQRPEDLPTRDTLKSWAGAQGIPRAKLNKMLTIYRLGRTELNRHDPSSALPDIDRVPVCRGRGIHSLPDIVDVADRVGHQGPISQLDTMIALEHVAPMMHQALGAYIDKARDEGLSAEWERNMISMVSRTVAAVSQTGLWDVRSLLPADLFFATTAVPRARRSDKEGSEYERALEERYGVRPESGACEIEEVPLLFPVIDAMAVSACDSSPTDLRPSVAKRLSAGEVPFYPPALHSEVARLASLARHPLEADERRYAKRLVSLNVVKKAVLDHMNRVNAKRGVLGRRLDKTVSLDYVTYPLAVCIGLPALAAKARRLGKHFFAACERHGYDLQSRAVRSAARRYDKVLTEYMVTAVYLADGLREKNYVYARVGKEGLVARLTDAGGADLDPTHTHFWPEIDRESGEIVGLRTFFTGDDHRLPRLKIRYRSSKTKEIRTRKWHIRPGLVDFDLLNEYMQGTRPRNLFYQGLIKSVDDYSLRRDIDEWNFAMFVSPSSSKHDYRRTTGAYSPGQLAAMVRRSLHWMAKDVLGNGDLPELDSPEWRERFERVLTGHITRSMIASYWMGIRGQADLACDYTNDAEQTLREQYKRVTTEQLHAEFIGKPDWMRPDHFDDVIDRIWYKGEVIDWEKEGALRPRVA